MPASAVIDSTPTQPEPTSSPIKAPLFITGASAIVIAAVALLELLTPQATGLLAASLGAILGAYVTRTQAKD